MHSYDAEMVVFDIPSVLKTHVENGSARPVCNICVVALVLVQGQYAAVTCGKIAVQDECAAFVL